MKKQSAGLLVYRIKDGQAEVLLVHPGGPFWAKKDLGAWSIPKGEFEEDEDALHAAKREFSEEIGQQAPDAEYLELGETKLKSGKIIYAWAAESDLDSSKVKSNTFEMEWPPKSSNMQNFPEVDKAGWFSLDKAKEKINQGQQIFLERLANFLHVTFGSEKIPKHSNQQQLF